MTIRSKKIEDEELKDWRDLSFNETYEEISASLPKKTPLSSYTVANALRTGYCSEKTYTILAKRYAAKAAAKNPVTEETHA